MSRVSSVIDFQGVWPDVLVPLQADFSVDEPRLASHLRNLSANGLQKFVLFGQAGEGATFSNEEKLSAVTFVIKAGVKPTNIILGVNSSSYTDVAQFIRSAYAKGLRRFLVSAPLYDHPFCHLGLFDYFDQIVKQVNQADWQLYLHQLGGKNQASDLSEVTIAYLKKEHPLVFVGLVDQDVHVNHTLELIRSFDALFAIAPCHEPNLAILNSAEVCVSALANVIPNIMKQVIANDFVNNASKIAGMKVTKTDDRVTELMTILGKYPQVAALKLMLAQHYRMDSWERVRPPNTTLSNEGRVALLAAFKIFNLQANE